MKCVKSTKSKSIHVPLTPHVIRDSTTDTMPPFCEFENDDRSERRDRRQSKILELHQNALDSPQISVDRRLSMGSAISGLTNAQMTEHYSNCIKLSSENKITMKNAFNLHLIDYMQNMIKKKDSEMENFQVASCTLDASAKIYASRVDFVYSETFKVAGGLSRKNEKATKVQNDSNDEEKKDDDDNGPTPVKKRKVRRLRTIEQNLENLNLNKLDNEYSLDPLHQKLRHAFDEGGTSGLLLNTLSIADDSCQLQFDSRILAFGARENKLIRDDVFDLTNMSQAINKILDPDIKICPYFANFSFLCSEEEENQFLNSSRHDDFAFDPEKCNNDPAVDIDSFSNDLRDDCDNFETEQQITKDTNSENRKAEYIRTGEHIDLHTALSTQPSDYSYFNVDFLRSWAGPDRWHTVPLSKTTTTRIQNKQKKESFFVKFDKEIDWSKEFKIDKQSKELSKRTLTTAWSRQKNILPLDLHYKPEMLRKLFLKSKLTVTRQKPSLEVDDAINQYDYENANDCDNFCPAQDSGNDHSADLFSTKYGSFDETCGTTFNSNGFGDGTLVQQPYKVTKIDIPYARTAKRIDVKKVKSGLWKIIHPMDSKTGSETSNNEIKFSTLYKKLPTCISGKTLENMSVPIAFVCLLYLANEKKLDIVNGENLKDLLINQ